MGEPDPSRLCTPDRRFYPGYVMPLAILDGLLVSPGPRAERRYKIVFITEGTLIATLGAARKLLPSPCILCLGEREELVAVEEESVRARTLVFHPSIVNGKFDFDNVATAEGFSVSEDQDRYWFDAFRLRGGGRSGFVPLGPLGAERVSRFFDAVSSLIAEQPDEGWPCRSRSYFIELLFLIRQIQDRPELPGEGNEALSEVEALDRRLEKTLLHIHTHYGEKLTLNGLAERFGTNRTSLNAAFNKAFGLPVIAYLNALRMRVAAAFLHDTHLSISETMYRVGFSDPGHFRRTFSRTYGLPPAEYREKYCWMN